MSVVEEQKTIDAKQGRRGASRGVEEDKQDLKAIARKVGLLLLSKHPHQGTANGVRDEAKASHRVKCRLAYPSLKRPYLVWNAF